MAPDLSRAANFATIVVAACAVVATVAMLDGFGGRRGDTSAAAPDSVLVPDWREYLAGGHSRGPQDAPVTILEFGDYECPFCARFSSDIDRVLAAYPTAVRFVYRHWPLTNHRFAYPAARAAECAAEQGRFWEIHTILYAKQDSLGLISFTDLAHRAGVPDTGRFTSCARSPDSITTIEHGIRDAKLVGGTGTPTVIVNGVLKRRGIDSAYVAAVLAAMRNQ